MKSMRISSGALALFFGLGLALPASAQTEPFQMIGSWLDQRGIAVQIPALPIEGVPANTIVQQTTATTNGRQITIPTGAFARAAVPGGTATVPIVDPAFAQLASNFQLDGPVAVTEGTQMNVGNVLQKQNWSVNNTRPFLSFSWCPGASANPNCANRNSSTGVGGTAPPGSGSYHGIVKYSNTNPNQYGGTMQMLIGTPQGAAALGRNFGPTQVAHFPVGGVGAQNTNIFGAAYAGFDTVLLPPAPITVPVSRTTPMGVILVGGPQVGTFGSSATNNNHGFPFTTGMVVISGSMGAAPPTTFTISGSDTRTPNGSGMVTLVAGGITNSVGAFGTTTLVRTTVTMTLVAPGTVPAMKPALAAGVALAMLGLGFAFRRRLF